MVIVWSVKDMIPGVVNSQVTTQKTANPTINTPFFATTWKYTVKNNDDLTVTIYADCNTNPPTTARGSVASDLNSVTINTGFFIGGFMIYARAQAAGKDMSDVVSYYVSE